MQWTDRSDKEDVWTKEVWHNNLYYTITRGTVDLSGSIKVLCLALVLHPFVMLVFWGQFLPPFSTSGSLLSTGKLLLCIFLAVLVFINAALLLAVRRRHSRFKRWLIRGKLVELACCLAWYGYVFTRVLIFATLVTPPLLFWLPLWIAIVIFACTSERIAFTFDPANNQVRYPANGEQ